MAVLITAEQLPAIAAYADMNAAASSETIVQESTAAFSVQNEKEVSPQGVLTMDSSFSVSGTVSSDSLIAKAYGGIYKAEGSDCEYDDRFAFTRGGGRKSFNLSAIDNDIVFNELPVGEYE